MESFLIEELLPLVAGTTLTEILQPRKVVVVLVTIRCHLHIHTGGVEPRGKEASITQLSHR